MQSEDGYLLLHRDAKLAVQRGRGLVELCRMLSRLRRGCDVGINVVLSAGRYIEDLGAQQLAPV